MTVDTRTRNEQRGDSSAKAHAKICFQLAIGEPYSSFFTTRTVVVHDDCSSIREYSVRGGIINGRKQTGQPRSNSLNGRHDYLDSGMVGSS
jgi:hypothetical protein